MWLIDGSSWFVYNNSGLYNVVDFESLLYSFEELGTFLGIASHERILFISHGR